MPIISFSYEEFEQTGLLPRVKMVRPVQSDLETRAAGKRRLDRDVLLIIRVLPELPRRDHLFRRPRVLQGVVELPRLGRVLAAMEHACAQLVHPTRLQPSDLQSSLS